MSQSPSSRSPTPSGRTRPVWSVAGQLPSDALSTAELVPAGWCVRVVPPLSMRSPSSGSALSKPAPPAKAQLASLERLVTLWGMTPPMKSQFAVLLSERMLLRIVTEVWERSVTRPLPVFAWIVTWVRVDWSMSS